MTDQNQKASDPTSNPTPPVATPPSSAPPATSNVAAAPPAASPNPGASNVGPEVMADLEAVGEDFKGIILALREEYASASPKTKADIEQLLKDASVFRGETLSALRAALGK